MKNTQEELYDAILNIAEYLNKRVYFVKQLGKEALTTIVKELVYQLFLNEFELADIEDEANFDLMDDYYMVLNFVREYEKNGTVKYNENVK